MIPRAAHKDGVTSTVAIAVTNVPRPPSSTNLTASGAVLGAVEEMLANPRHAAVQLDVGERSLLVAYLESL